MMRGKARIFMYVAVFVLFIAGSTWLYSNLQARVNPLPSVETGQGDVKSAEAERTKAPDFTVHDGDGRAVKLSDWLGKPVVLNFWASWCPPCKGEMPHFDAVYAELGDEIQFMMVDLVDGGRETEKTGAAYVAEQGFSFPVYFDISGEAGAVYGVRSIPTTIFIDREGFVVTGAQGAIDEATLRRGIGMLGGAEDQN